MNMMANKAKLTGGYVSATHFHIGIRFGVSYSDHDLTMTVAPTGHEILMYIFYNYCINSAKIIKHYYYWYVYIQ